MSFHRHLNDKAVIEAVLAENGCETIREAAKRIGISPTSVWTVMRRNGYRSKPVTVWHRGVSSEAPDMFPRTGGRDE